MGSVISIFDTKDNSEIINRAGKEYVQFDGREYNPIKDGDLQALDRIKKADWNTPNIIEYLLLNPQISTIYFTRRSDQCWGKRINLIQMNCPNVTVIPIYTPSAQGGALHRHTGIYGEMKMKPLLRHWVHNNVGNYGKLDNNWLAENGVDIDNF